MKEIYIKILRLLDKIKLELLENRQDLGEQDYNNLNRNVVSMQKIISTYLQG